MLRVRILGSGTSSGVPTIACTCPTCTSTDPRDKRLRPSIWVRDDETSIIIDTSSDFRQQCLQAKISSLDAVVYTHHHFDHIAGFDDLRAFNFKTRRPVPIYLLGETLNELRNMFSYAFATGQANESSVPLVKVEEVAVDPFVIGSLTLTPLPLMHGRMKVNGYRIGNFAYCTDCNRITDEAYERMEGLDVLVLDALRLTEHPTHFSLAQAVTVAERVGAHETYFTHIAHEIKHSEVEGMLSGSMFLAYDGLELTVE